MCQDIDFWDTARDIFFGVIDFIQDNPLMVTLVGALVSVFIFYPLKGLIRNKISTKNKEMKKIEPTASLPEHPIIHPYIPNAITMPAPPINKEFSYRDDMVDKLYKDIKQNQKLALINGLGGIGKTTVAKALYHRVKDECEHIAWVEYQHNFKESLLNSFIIFNKVEDTAERYREIENFLLDATKDTIIFIDNVSNLDSSGVDFIERLAANVVLTSRLSSIGNFKLFPVDFLSEEQSVKIFYKYYEHDKAREQKEAVHKLVELVKCHTLSVELLARAANRPGYPLEEYVEKLKEKGFEYPDLSVKASHAANTQTIAEHLQALFELVSVNDEQKRILKNFALMPSFEIPAEVEKWLDCKIDDIIELTKLGWLSVSEIGYEMHPIVKDAILLQYKEVKYEDFKSIISYMSGNKYVKATDIYTRVHVRLNIAESIMSHLCDFEKEEIGRLFNYIANVYSNQGEYAKALKWHYKSLVIKEKVLGLEHPSTATAYNNIALVYSRQGEYANALEWHYKSLVIKEKVLGLEHPSTATTYNNIALVYSRQGEYANALEWYHKTLIIDEKVLGLEHPDTAATYNNIADVYSSQGENAKALEWYQNALAINEKVLGLEHPSTATTYNNIASVYSSQGEYAKALEWHQKALVIREKVLGLEHPDTAISYNNIADVYSSQGENAKALEWYQNALAIKEKVLGLEHPSTAITYNNIANVYSNQGENAKALEWHQKALIIKEKVLGLEHPSTAATYNNIALVYSSQGENAKALEWHQKALIIKEKALGLEHPDTAITYNNIANVYSNQGDHTKALEWYQKALAIKEKVLSLEDPSIAITYNNIADVYSDQGEYVKALKWYKKALAIGEKVFGLEHPNTIIIKKNIMRVRGLLN